MPAFPAHAAPLRVTLLVSEDSTASSAFAESLSARLPADRYSVKVSRVEESVGGADLYVAVGVKAAIQVATKDAPVLNVFVPRSSYDRLPHVVATRSAIYLDQPIERQLALLTSALPGLRHVGVLYTEPPPELAGLRRLLVERKLRLHERGVDQTHQLNDALEAVLEESEVLFVLPDADIYNAGTIRNILLTSYRKQVPLIGISQAYVKAGALCAVYSSPEQVAAQAATMIERFAASGKLPAPQYPADFVVSVNIQVARSLDLHIKDAERLREEIRRQQ
jgi:ABC-type uncharacterized transport system substrate-binding protein